ncbi:MAG: NUDIX domain-containing protein [Bacillota bacterium]
MSSSVDRRLGAYGLLVRGRDLLMIRKVRGPWTGLLDLPGGKVEDGETLAEAIRREFAEETGLDVEVASQLGAFDLIREDPRDPARLLQHIGVYYRVTAIGGTLNESGDGLDSSGAVWVDPTALEPAAVVPLAWKALRAAGVVEVKPLRVLFMCGLNSTRSQMAEGLARQLGGGRLIAASAGLQATAVDPRAVAIAAEIGVDLSRQWSKVVDDEMLGRTDLVVTLCDPARDSCPVLPPGVARRHWPIRSLDELSRPEVPENVWRPAYRAVRDELRARVAELIREV